MITFANDLTAPSVRRMWKVCFGDTEEFMDIFFTDKYRNENTLIYIEDNIPVASLQMLSYTITFYGETIPFAYLAGLCTLPGYRRRGYMEQLIFEAHRILAERGISLAILIPAQNWLYGFYEKYGYQQVFDKSDELIPLDKILEQYPDMDEAYKAFDSIFRKIDFCVQKSREDFDTIVKEYTLDNHPPKTNLSGMARIIDPWALLKLYADKNKMIRLCFEVDNDTTYLIKNGWVEPIDGLGSDMKVDIRMLCRLLFGYKTDELEKSLNTLFPVHHPVMNFMLE